MIFAGDLSVPNEVCAKMLVRDMENSGLFCNQTVVLNLEGVITEREQDSSWKVYNHRSVVGIKNVCGQLICSLANNHIYDYPESIEYGKMILERNKIKYFGLYEDGKPEPLYFEDNEGESYAIFGHCWQVYTRVCKNKKTFHKVVDCSYQDYFDMVIEYIKKKPSVKIICFLHWNFDMEELPFPAYKELAHKLIDSGVEAVIGNHSHVVQEVELYRGKVIAYALGNFYMPDGYFFNGRLVYPEKSHRCIAIQIFNDGSEPIVHEFATDCPDNHALKYLNAQNLHEGISYDKFAHKQYVKEFRKKRCKNKLVPVFRTYHDTLENRIKTIFIIGRIKVIRFIKMNLMREKK